MTVQTVPGQAQPASSPTSLPSWAGPGCMQQSLSSPPHLLQPDSENPMEDMGLASPCGGSLLLPSQHMCPFQSKRLCSARCGVWEEGVLDTKAVCSGELQELAVQSPPSSVCWRSGCPCRACLLLGNGHRRRACSEDLSGGLPAAVEKNPTLPLCCPAGQFFLESECLSLQWLLMQRMWRGRLKAFKDLSPSQNMLAEVLWQQTGKMGWQ